MMNSMERESSDEGEPAKRLTKKVCIRETEGDTDVAMDSALITEKPLLWKDRLMRTRLQAKGQTTTTNDISNEGEFELPETDVVRSSVNGIPSISFSEWVNQILINNMAHIMVIKLLGRSTGYSALYNKSPEDFEKVICQGPWIIYGQYLTVQPWSMDFNITQPYSRMVMEWIRFLGLPGHMYNGESCGT
ncbi:hypothetical protein Gorai_006377 [Gossypium raimondii]|uniref:DUF4283 domain-containing protein n=1 Tax=Gossypium raimondii TaxID=29730 RepID=A0A7J8QF41_GOSRA|nr:hypothetical protein [Gossypium raimondii]